MDRKGAIEGRVLVYIIIIIVGIILVIVFLELFTPYKISSWIDSLISAGGSYNGGNYA